MKIRSIRDVITNSSSEVFVIKHLFPLDLIRDLKEFHESNKLQFCDTENYLQATEAGKDYWGSGDGGVLEILDSDKNVGTVSIRVDENFGATQNYIKTNYKVIGSYHT